MKDGSLPPRPGDESATVNYNHEKQKITLEINSIKQEVDLPEAIAFACQILSMVEVVMRNERE